MEDDDYSLIGKGTVVGGPMTIGVDADVLPTCAFQNAYNLKTLILPRTCKKVRTRAMIGCEDLETLVIGDDMEDFNWDALDDGASLTRMYILAKKKPEIGAEWAVWRWLCNNYNPTFDAFYVRPSLYQDYVADANYTGSSWQRTNNISKGAFDDDDSFCAFAAHAAATKDDLATVTSVEGWFDGHPGVKNLTPLKYTAVDSLSKATFAPLAQLEQMAMPAALSAIEEGLFEQNKKMRYVDFLACQDDDFVSSLTYTGMERMGLDREHTLLYMPAAYGYTGEDNVVWDNGGKLQAQKYYLIDSLDYMVPYAFEVGIIDNDRKLKASEVPYTVCLPYTLKVPEYARAYELSERDGNTLIFEEVIDEMEAMKPYLLKVNGSQRLNTDYVTLYTYTPQTIPASGGTTYGHQDDTPGYSLRGSFNAISNAEAAELGAYVLQSDGNWHPVTTAQSQVSLKPFRAFLLPSARHAGTRAISMSLVDENTTGIDTIETIDQDGTHRYYDLNGREIDVRSAKGIVIRNGKKVIK